MDDHHATRDHADAEASRHASNAAIHDEAIHDELSGAADDAMLHVVAAAQAALLARPGSPADDTSSAADAEDLLRGGLLEREERGPTARAESLLRGAADAATRAGDGTLLAIASLALGETLLEHADDERLRESIRWHQRAERLFRTAGDVEHAALCQINTAVAYLALPAGAGFKAKIAVQCLRAALAMLDRARHPDVWAGAALNLANALQQLPPSPGMDEFIEAVTLYHELLDVRPAAGDARGRVLANLGCALGKLGRLDDAEARLLEALACFGADADACEGVLATLAEVRAAREAR